MVKLLWLAICNVEDKRSSEKRKSLKANKESTGNHLIEGVNTAGWTQALGHLAIPLVKVSTKTG